MRNALTADVLNATALSRENHLISTTPPHFVTGFFYDFDWLCHLSFDSWQFLAPFAKSVTKPSAVLPTQSVASSFPCSGEQSSVYRKTSPKPKLPKPKKRRRVEEDGGFFARSPKSDCTNLELAISQLELEIHNAKELNTVREPTDWLQMVAKW